jgi:hypothetical protein
MRKLIMTMVIIVLVAMVPVVLMSGAKASGGGGLERNVLADSAGNSGQGPCKPDEHPAFPPRDLDGPGFPGPEGPGGKGFMPGPGGKGFVPMLPARLEKEDLEKVEKFLKEYDPVKYKEIMTIKEKDLMLYNRIASDIARDLLFMERIKKENPEVFKSMVEEKALESSCHELAKSLRDEKDAAKIGRIKEELRQKLSRMFDLRQFAREERIKHIEKDIATLKSTQEQRKKNRDRIIDLRLNEMVGGAEGLEW